MATVTSGESPAPTAQAPPPRLRPHPQHSDPTLKAPIHSRSVPTAAAITAGKTLPPRLKPRPQPRPLPTHAWSVP